MNRKRIWIAGAVLVICVVLLWPTRPKSSEEWAQEARYVLTNNLAFQLPNSWQTLNATGYVQRAFPRGPYRHLFLEQQCSIESYTALTNQFVLRGSRKATSQSDSYKLYGVNEFGRMDSNWIDFKFLKHAPWWEQERWRLESVKPFQGGYRANITTNAIGNHWSAQFFAYRSDSNVVLLVYMKETGD